MPTYKTITIPKRGGGTRRQRVQVLASGKYKFVKNVKGAGTRSKPSNKPKSRGKPRMAGKGKGRGGGRKIFGTIGWKGAIASVASLSLIRILVNRLTGGSVPGEYVDSVAMLGAGVVGKATKIGTAHLLAPGAVLGISKFIEDMVSPGGLYTVPSFAGTRGYDF